VALVPEVPEWALGVPEWALGVQVLAQAGSVPVEARKQSRATLPLSQVAERPLQGAVAWALGSVLAQEALPVAAREAETVAALEVVQAVGTEAAQV
jgi:hypothetical protein